MLDRRDRCWWRRRPVAGIGIHVVAPTPPAAAAAARRARADPRANGPRAPGHHGHARAPLQPRREADEGPRDSDQTVGRRHVPVNTQQPAGRQRQVGRHRQSQHVVGRRITGRERPADRPTDRAVVVRLLPPRCSPVDNLFVTTTIYCR